MLTGEDERRTSRGPVELVSVLREAQLPALVAVVEVQREREHPVRRGRRQVVAMRPKEAAGDGVVAGDLESLESARPKRERLPNLGKHAAADDRGQLAQQLGIADGVVATPLVARVEDVAGQAGDAGLDSPCPSHTAISRCRGATSRARGSSSTGAGATACVAGPRCTAASSSSVTRVASRSPTTIPTTRRFGSSTTAVSSPATTP